jgi:hypothetical protein
MPNASRQPTSVAKMLVFKKNSAATEPTAAPSQ